MYLSAAWLTSMPLLESHASHTRDMPHTLAAALGARVQQLDEKGRSISCGAE